MNPVRLFSAGHCVRARQVSLSRMHTPVSQVSDRGRFMSICASQLEGHVCTMYWGTIGQRHWYVSVYKMHGYYYPRIDMPEDL